MVVTELTLISDVTPLSSYGTVGIQTVLELEKRGITVYLPFQPQDPEHRRYIEQCAPEMLPILDRPVKETEWGIAHHMPYAVHYLSTPRNLSWTMIEATRLPPAWAGIVNTAADGVIVPSRGMVPYFRQSGVNLPIFVAPDPINVDAFTYVDRPQRDTFTLITFGELTVRKCPVETIVAFRKAFPHQDDVKLIMKSRNGHWGVIHRNRLQCSDPRITLIDADYTVDQLVNLCHQADAGIFLSRGEGSGNCAPQAAATGLGCVVPGHSGCVEWANPDHFYVVGLDPKHPELPAPPLFAQWGSFLNMDMDQTVETLRHMYEHPREVRDKGRAAAQWVRANFTPRHTVDGILAAIEALS